MGRCDCSIAMYSLSRVALLVLLFSSTCMLEHERMATAQGTQARGSMEALAAVIYLRGGRASRMSSKKFSSIESTRAGAGGANLVRTLARRRKGGPSAFASAQAEHIAKREIEDMDDIELSEEMRRAVEEDTSTGEYVPDEEDEDEDDDEEEDGGKGDTDAPLRGKREIFTGREITEKTIKKERKKEKRKGPWDSSTQEEIVEDEEALPKIDDPLKHVKANEELKRRREEEAERLREVEREKQKKAKKKRGSWNIAGTACLAWDWFQGRSNNVYDFTTLRNRKFGYVVQLYDLTPTGWISFSRMTTTRVVYTCFCNGITEPRGSEFWGESLVKSLLNMTMIQQLARAGIDRNPALALCSCLNLLTFLSCSLISSHISIPPIPPPPLPSASIPVCALSLLILPLSRSPSLSSSSPHLSPRPLTLPVGQGKLRSHPALQAHRASGAKLKLPALPLTSPGAGVVSHPGGFRLHRRVAERQDRHHLRQKS
eukprot:766223-Hanusia_phi.AAC.1